MPGHQCDLLKARLGDAYSNAGGLRAGEISSVELAQAEKVPRLLRICGEHRIEAPDERRGMTGAETWTHHTLFALSLSVSPDLPSSYPHPVPQLKTPISVAVGKPQRST